MKLQAPLPDPAKARLFGGRMLRDVLTQRTNDAVALVQRLNLSAWDDDANPAQTIAEDFDVSIPEPSWDAGTVQIGTSADQKMRAVWSWPVTGDPRLLDHRPDSHLIGGPTGDVGMIGGRTIVATVTDWTLSAEQIDRAATDARHYVDRHTAFLRAQVELWRVSHTARVRDAANARRALLAGIAVLNGR